jgi:hypothetical protein
MEQRQAKPPLQLGDPLGDRRLGQIHRARRGADAPAPHHRGNRGEMPDIYLVEFHAG